MPMSKSSNSDRIIFSSREFLKLLEGQGLTGNWGWTFASDEHFWSPGLYRLLGLEAGTNRPSYATFLARVHPEDRFRLESPAQVVQEGRLRNHKVRVIRPDGSIRMLSCRNEVYHLPDGRPRGAAGVMLDVTDQDRLFAVQATERRRRQALFEQTQSWTYTTLYFQSKPVASHELIALTGISHEEFLADPHIAIALSDRERARDYLQSMLQFGRPFVSNKLLLLANGEKSWFRFFFAPVRDDHNAIISWATMNAPLGGPMMAPLDAVMQRGIESGLDGRYISAARALLGWSMQDLAAFSGLSFSSIRRLEDDGENSSARIRSAAILALRQSGIVFSFTHDNKISIYRN